MLKTPTRLLGGFFIALALLLSFSAHGAEFRQISQILNSSGKPVVNGYIYVGTYNLDPVANPISLFSDSALSVPIANPVRTDSYGRPTTDIYFAESQYSYTLKDSASVVIEGPKNRDAIPTQASVASNQASTATSCGTFGGTANALSCTLSPVPTAYTDLMAVRGRLASDNTGAVTLDANGIGARTVVKWNGTALAAGDLKQNDTATFAFDSTNNRWQLQSPNAAVTIAGASTISGDKTFSGATTLAGVNTFTGVLAGASPLIFEGATADANETTLAITDPTADRTITVPDLTGTVLLSAYDSATSTDVARTIASGSLNGAGDTTINIPAGAWKKIELEIVGLTTATDYQPYLRINADAGANYDGLQGVHASGSVVNQVSPAATAIPLVPHNVLVESTTNPQDWTIFISDPAGATNRKKVRISDTFFVDSVGTQKATFGTVGRWNSAAAITSVSILLRDTTGASPAGATVNASGGTYILRGYR